MGRAIWLLSLNPGLGGYDCYHAHVIVADTEDRARAIAPCADECPRARDRDHSAARWRGEGDCTWEDPAKVKCERIGHANAGTEEGVVCSDFHAG